MLRRRKEGREREKKEEIGEKGDSARKDDKGGSKGRREKGAEEGREGGREGGKEGERETEREDREGGDQKRRGRRRGGGWRERGSETESERPRQRETGRERQRQREREGRREVHTRATKSPSNGKCEAARNKVGKRSKKRGRESYAKHRNRRGTTNALRYCQRWRERDQEQPGIREVLGGSRSELISAGIMGTAGGE